MQKLQQNIWLQEMMNVTYKHVMKSFADVMNLFLMKCVGSRPAAALVKFWPSLALACEVVAR